MKRLLQIFLIGFALSLYPSIACAQPKTPDEETKKQLEAMKRFEEAEKLYNIGDFEAALTGYKEAYLLSNNPDLLYNMGQCYRKLGKYDDALITYRSYLREVPNSPVKADVEARITEVEKEKANPRFSKVVISSNPSGAEVHKGGSTSRVVGTTPFTIEELPAGEHVFTLTFPGFEPYEINLTSEGGKDYVVPEAKLQKEKKLKPDWAYRLSASAELFGSNDLNLTSPNINFAGGAAHASLERYSQDRKKLYGLMLGGGGGTSGFFSAGAVVSYAKPLKNKPLLLMDYSASFGFLGLATGSLDKGTLQQDVALYARARLQIFREGEFRGSFYVMPLEAGIALGPTRRSVELGLLGLGYAWGLRKRE